MNEKRHDTVARMGRDGQGAAIGLRRNFARRLLSRLTTAVLLILLCVSLYIKGPVLGPLHIAASTHDGQLQQLIEDYGTQLSTESQVLEYCPQESPLIPSSPLHKTVINIINSPAFEEVAIEKFQKSITFKTVSTDAMAGVNFSLNDTAYREFTGFRKFLSDNFPRVYENMKPQNVNTHGVLMAWKGTNPRLKPTLLTAHYDVVPVDNSTLAQWEPYGPFNGNRSWDAENKTERIYGRGATDMKHSLMSIMSAMETLIDNGFHPRRTIMIAFGFDEELGGLKGHLNISKVVYDCVNGSGIAVLADEGGGQGALFGKDAAFIGVAEKGYLDVTVVVRVLGGHASLPDPHTGIGIASAFVASVENEAYNVYMSPGHPMLSYLGCGLEHGDMSETLIPLVEARLKQNATWPDMKNDTLALTIAGHPNRTNQVYWLMATTQAVTMFNGGLKSNILPETVTIKINHRIHINEKVEYVMKKLERHAHLMATKFNQTHNLTIFGFNETKENVDYVPPDTARKGSISLIASRPKEAAPITETSFEIDGNKTAFAVVAGTVKAVMGADMIVSPVQNAANTDSRHYWGVTSNIMRYIPAAWEADGAGVHTVRESMSVKGHMKGIEYFATFVQNMDEADLYEDTLKHDFTCWDKYN